MNLACMLQASAAIAVTFGGGCCSLLRGQSIGQQSRHPVCGHCFVCDPATPPLQTHVCGVLQVTGVMHSLIRSIPTHKWLLVLPQLTSRMCHVQPDVQVGLLGSGIGAFADCAAYQCIACLCSQCVWCATCSHVVTGNVEDLGWRGGVTDANGCMGSQGAGTWGLQQAETALLWCVPSRVTHY
jgi:hypothetical protein